jgi:sugar transferase (PEP-CTERM/EpsH1 system associated)
VRILFLTHRLPYAPNRGDRVRAFHLLRSLATWARVDLVSLAHDAEEATHVRDLERLASSVTIGRVSHLRNRARAALALPTSTPTTHTLLGAPGLRAAVETVAVKAPPDLVFCYCTGIGPMTAIPAIADAPLVLDMVDVDSAKWATLSASAPWPRSWIYAREARVLGAYESRLAMRARCTLVVTSRERDALHALAPSARVEIVPNGVDSARLTDVGNVQRGDDHVVFCGVMNYAPNVEGVLWFVRTIWPEVRKRRPNARFTIVGSDPTPAVEALAAEPGVEVTRAVADVRPFLWRATISVAPLLTARGVQNKVLEAVAAGLPAIVTPAVAEGLPTEVAPACFTAADASSFAQTVVNLLGLVPAERAEIVARARVSELSWDRRLAPLEAILREAASVEPQV